MGRREAAVVRLTGWAAGRPTAGLGVLVGCRAVVTCAHVVNTALGLGQRAQAWPGGVVQVEFPLLPGVPVRTARVVSWVPPPLAGAAGEAGVDVAGLLLNEDAPAGAVPARFAAVTAPGARLRVFGYPGSPPRATGAWVDLDVKGEVSGQLVQVESRSDQSIKAQPGYSGAPVWQEDAGVVVGLLHASAFADEPWRDAYLVPAGVVAAAWEEQFGYLLVPQNPYRGLEPFTAEHAGVYFGRQADVEALAERVAAQPVVVVVGPSGVGKSSLVQAGLIPRPTAGQPWADAVVRPGPDPWHRLAAGLLRARQRAEGSPGNATKAEVEREIEQLRAEGFGPTARFLRSVGRPLLVVVDQFEELLAGDQLPEPALLDLLLPPAELAEHACRVVHTLRADFLPPLLAVPGVAPRLDQRLFPLSPLTEDQIREAVTQPAVARGVSFQEGLAELIVRDAAAGSLPLLEFTLTRLWHTQRRKTVDFTGYQAMGGVAGALDQFADQQARALAGLGAEVVDRMLLRLVRVAAGDPDLATRQRVYQAQTPPGQWQALRQLAQARLVIVGDDPAAGPCAELAHEALITSWRRLRDLVRDNAEFLDWLAGARRRAEDGDPLPEARIAEARRWLDTRAADIPAPIQAFVTRSQTAAEARLREMTEARDRVETARQQAEAAARRAEALRLAADAELALRSGGAAATVVALALGAESVLTEATLQGDLALRHVLRLHPRTLARLDHGGSVGAVAFAADGTRVATGSVDGSARVFDVATGAELARLDHGGPVGAVAFAADGTRVATGSGDGSARVFDAATGAELARLDHGGPVRAVAFAADGTRVVTGSVDGSARVFEASPERLLDRVFTVMTRPLDTAELRRHSLPANCRHVEQWQRRRAHPADSNPQHA
jgi:hypothetical protein